ncbi:kinase-like protein [Pleomassaria siparia CBS 279.74]|uniref:Kinase-like protein n=1 Tax=Pleomassaria siparia CBS 279.74 TaxID=1314801 RepID=A0A6G1JV70_9PLEO|nr:kinase-like protein [Pleomassaria siparia CBS 279.74]
MSLFRRPGEDSSSDDEDSRCNQDANNASQEDLSNMLSRINTLNSTSPQNEGSGRQTPLSAARPAISRSNSEIKDLLFHTLLEEQAIRVAAQHLDRDVSHPDVQEKGREVYRAITQQLSGSQIVDEEYASDEMQQNRATAQEGIFTAMRSYLTGLPAAEASGSMALVPQTQTTSRPLSGLFSAMQSPLQSLLQSYPGLHTDHYARDFIQLDIVGKGGYGKVYKVQHRLDNALYAVKRITVSPARLQKMQEKNIPQEMEKLLEEVRALARFDHGNIVRYHSAWLEFTTGHADASVPIPDPGPLSAHGRFIRSASSTRFNHMSRLDEEFSDISLGNRIDNSLSVDDQDYGGVVFENSETGAGAEESRDETSSLNVPDLTTNRDRRASHASYVSSVGSLDSERSFARGGHDEDDEDVETIPRTHRPQSLMLTSDFSDGMVSNSDVPNKLFSPRLAGPVLTLNVQMSLYDTSLAAFITPDQPTFTTNPNLHHCFHPGITLEIVTHILSGVDYLHAQGVVHRDLKPANVFLSLSTSRIPPYGSVDLCACQACPSHSPSMETSTSTLVRSAQNITPRIGDFGLIAALSDIYPSATTDTAPRPVGTEFYRPLSGGAVSEKLDVYALGIVTFEMLCEFGTRMERIEALMQIRRGGFPNGFLEGLGECGDKVGELLMGMCTEDEKQRMGCEQVRQAIDEILGGLKK